MSDRFRAQDFVEQACRQTGLDDFGCEGWREGLERLVDSINGEARLNRDGRQIFSLQVGARLADRLRIVDWAKAHPEPCSRPIERPLFVTGMLRTGTTFVSALLHCDPRNRSLMKWEVHDPIPPPERESFTSDPRIAKAVAQAEWRYDQLPLMRAVHYEPGDGPTECVFLLGQSFRSQEFSGLYKVPSYSRWHHSADLRPAYRHHRQALQVLQSRAPGRWCLKAPGHCFGLGAILELYPDARVLVTHRDPVESVPSAALPSVAGRSLEIHEDLDPRYWGEEWLRVLGESVERMMEFRDAHPELRVCDLFFEDLNRDPIGEMRRIYAFFGDALEPAAEAAMRRHVERRPRHQYGKVAYTPEDFGLDAGRIRERFARYTRRFELGRSA